MNNTRKIHPQDRWILNSSGNIVGVQSADANSAMNVEGYDLPTINPVTGEMSGLTKALAAAGVSPYGITKIIAQSAVPTIVLPSGTVNATGQFTLGVALPYTPTGTINVYVYAGVGLAAGLYPAVFSNTTTCQLVGYPATTAGAYAGGIADVALETVTVPGGSIGPNGSLEVITQWVVSNSANTKTPKVAISGKAFMSGNSGSSLTTQTYLRQFGFLQNRGSEQSNVYCPYSTSFNTSTPIYDTIDFSVDQNVTFIPVRANAADYTIIEGYVIKVNRTDPI